MKYLILSVLLILSPIGRALYAEEKASAAKAEDKHEDHADDGDEHHAEGEEEENESVGPEKGILEADEHKGFKLSPEALKNFEIKTVKISRGAPWSLPNIVVVRSGDEVNLFRVRGGFFKRIDFNILKKNGNQLVISSPDLQDGDEIVMAGLGLLRIAELSAFGGLAEGHSH